MNTRRRACAYVTNQSRLLVFDHVDYPEAGTQVPGGTMHDGEAPEDAALREAREETGLDELVLGSFLGRARRDMTDVGREEILETWYYHLKCTGDPPRRWRHDETCGGSESAIRFELYWVDAPTAASVLSEADGALLHAVSHAPSFHEAVRNTRVAELPARSERIQLVDADESDSGFAYRVKREAFRSYVKAIWGWDERLQRRLHDRRFAEQTYRLLRADGVDVGYVSLVEKPDCVHLNQLYVLPPHQCRGIGEACVALYQADGRKHQRAIRLHVLKINTRAQAFYVRLGFRKTGHSDHHLHMEWTP